MALRRFYAEFDDNSQQVVLDDHEAHHLQHVLRISRFEQVELFNGKGLIAQATVDVINREGVKLRIQSVSTVASAKRKLIVASAIPKGERADWLVEKLTELDVDIWIPLIFERSNAAPGEGKLRRWRQIVINASKQSRRTELLQVRDPQRALDSVPQLAIHGLWLLADPEGMPSESMMETIKHELENTTSELGCVVGPEGGLTDLERQTLSRCMRCISLGDYVLRVETATLCMAVLLNIVR